MSTFRPEDIPTIIQRFQEIPNEQPPTPTQGVYHKVVCHKKVFDALTIKPVFVNEFDTTREEERERLNELIFTEYEGETLTNRPTCSCGMIGGEDNLGVVCDDCGTPVQPVTEKPLQSLLWMYAPKNQRTQIPAFINMTVYRILNRHMRLAGFSIFQYLIDPYYTPRYKNEPKRVKNLKDLQLPIGLINFHDHFDRIIETLHHHGLLAQQPRIRKLLYLFIQQNRDRIFSPVIPCPSRLLFITEKNNDQIWVDDNLKGALHAITTFTKIYSCARPLDRRTLESRTVKVQNLLNEFYINYEKNICFKKQGIIRKLILGSRPNHTFRAVISSIHEPHDHRRTVLPWSLTVLLMATHIRSKLLRLDYNPAQMSALILENVMKNHPLIQKVLEELQSEAFGGSLEVDLVRFPLLRRLSTTHFDADFKLDPTDNTIGYSVLACVWPNADDLQ